MSARQPFRMFADFTGADPRFRAEPVTDCLGLMCHRPVCPSCFPAPPRRPESHAECILGKCPDPGMCDLMTNCEAWAIRRDFNPERDG